MKRRNPFANLENTVDAKRRAACLAECDFLVPVVEKENPEPVQVSPGTLRVNRPFIISRQKSANGRAPRHFIVLVDMKEQVVGGRGHVTAVCTWPRSMSPL